jgi:hypothetical protein
MLDRSAIYADEAGTSSGGGRQNPRTPLIVNDTFCRANRARLPMQPISSHLELHLAEHVVSRLTIVE